jgi:A/G-specific adenine glycosylase
MLQQTQVATVLPYYTAFLSRFPDPGALAQAPEAAVRAAWSGLGYYRRARNLQAAARTMVRDHGGSLPGSLEDLRALPGVGDYTAAALGSIVFGISKAVLDGNAIRVYTRLAAVGGNVSRTATRKELQTLADSLIPAAEPGDWNQAVMELGATVCTPRKPDCPACPWRAPCRAAAAGNPERYPVKNAAPSTLAVDHVVGVAVRDGAVLLVHRSHPRLLDGTWEFPGLEIAPGDDPPRRLAAHLRALWPGRPAVGKELAVVRHSITRRRITVRALGVTPAPHPRNRKGVRAWVRPEELSGYPVSSMTTKLMRALVTTGAVPARLPSPVVRPRRGDDVHQ